VVREYDRDPVKEAENLRRHGIPFHHAIVALLDPFAVGWFDEEHSIDEHRFVTVGRDLRGRLLTVVTSESRASSRIISARRATKRERDAYELQLPIGPG
jgi:uncharacterized protein